MILVTGGAGYIGSHTCLELLESGYELVVFDNYSNSSPEALRRVEELTGKSIKFYEADLLDRAAMDRIFEENEIEAVIHFAGLKAVGESVAKPLHYYRNNVTGTITLMESMQAHGVKRIIFSSSATVYGEHNPIPYAEDMPTGRCTNPYGQTKAMIEFILQDQCIADPQWSISLLRYFNPVGAHESGRIGEDPSGIPNNLCPFIAQVAVGKRSEVQVFGNDYDTRDGTGERDYIHVVDLAKGHLAALRRTLGRTGVEVFNLGTGKGISVLEMIHAFSAACGKDIPYRIAPRRPGDIAISYADTKKAADILGWRAEYDLARMCRDVWRWQSNNPNGYNG